MDPFVGSWTGLQLGGSQDIQDLLKEATLTIDPELGTPGAHLVSWTVGHEPTGVQPSGPSVNRRISGKFSTSNNKQYYYEIVAREAQLFPTKRCLYGIVCAITNRGGSGEELGDPGTWTAEENGPDTAG